MKNRTWWQLWLPILVCWFYLGSELVLAQPSARAPLGGEWKNEREALGLSYDRGRLVYSNLSMPGLVDQPLEFTGVAPIRFSSLCVAWELAPGTQPTGAEELNAWRLEFLAGKDASVAPSGSAISLEMEHTPKSAPAGLYISDLYVPNDGTPHATYVIKVYGPAGVKFKSFQLIFSDAGYGAAPTKPVVNPLPTPQSTCPPQPTVLGRETWWGNLPQNKFAYTPTYNTPTHIVVHHTAGVNNPSNPQATMRSMWDYHVNTNGWVDIGYNYCYDHLGNIYQARYNPQFPNTEVHGAHAGVNNSNTIGVSFMGTFSTILPTSAAMAANRAFLAWECKKLNIDPTTQAVKANKLNFRIFGHRDGAQAATTCPGDTLWSRLPLMRTQVKATMDACNQSTCSVPTNVSVSGVTTSGATVSWSAVSGASSYTVRHKPTASSTWTTVTGVTTTSTTLSGLSASTAHEVQVLAVCASGSSAFSGSATFTTLTPCGVPTNMSVSGVTTSGATVSWSAVSGASSYTVRHKPTASSTWTTITGVTTTSRTLTGLSASTAHEVQVLAVCASGSSAFSGSATFTTLTPCGVPTNVSVSGVTTSGATVSWSAVSGASSYTVRHKPTASSTWTTVTGVTTTSRTLTGLSASTVHEVQVLAVCASGSSAFSGSATFTTLTPCGVPTNVSVSGVTTSGATVSWSAVSGASSYTVRHKPTASSTWTTITGVTTTSRTLTGLSASTAHEVQVLAVCASGSSAFSGSATFTTLTPCGVPTNVSVSGVTTSGATVSWSAVSGASSYTVRHKPTASSTWTTITGVTTTSTTLSGLSASTAHEVQVLAVCASGSSAFSGSATFTTLTPCGVPTNVSVSGVTTSGATVSWSAVSGASSYTVRHKPTASSTWTTITGVTTTSRTLTGLSASTAHEVQVLAVCASGSSAFSGSATFTTQALCYDPYESNNSSTTATTMAPNSTLTAKICGQTDVDWYRVTLSSTTNLRFTLSELPANYNLELYINGTFVTGSYQTGTTNDVIVRNNQAAGTLFYRVYGQSSAFNDLLDYRVRAETSASAFREDDAATALSGLAEVQLYPNPSSGDFVVNLTLPDESPVAFRLVDMQGRILAQHGLSDQPAGLIRLTASEWVSQRLAAGVYVLQVATRYGLQNKKLIVQPD